MEIYEFRCVTGKYSINAHLNKITRVIWVDPVTIASISNDISLDIKYSSLSTLRFNNLRSKFKKEINKLNTGYLEIVLIDKINKLTSQSLYQQSFKISSDFFEKFEDFYSNSAMSNKVDFIESVVFSEHDFLI